MGKILVLTTGFLSSALLAPQLRAEAAALARPRSVQEILERASDWVVAIHVEREADLPSPAGRSREARAYFQRPPGCVSGVLVDREGAIVTTLYNVIGKVKSIQVTLPNHDSYPATLLGKSPFDDLALLRLERPASSPPLPFREPEWAGGAPLSPGQFIFALGRSPDPSKVTITRGILSAVTRNGGRAIQTDAKLNYGNAGGAILDLDGRIVAIAGLVGHTQPQWGMNSGVGFGTTAAAFLEMLPALKAGKEIAPPKAPLLGVKGDPNSLDVEGAKILEVIADGAAARAGLQAGDVILEVNGAPISNFPQLRRLIFANKVNDVVRLKVRRGSQVLEVEAKLGSRVGL